MQPAIDAQVTLISHPREILRQGARVVKDTGQRQ